MSLFSSAIKHTPTYRFDDFLKMGAHTKTADTRTTEQLLENIEYFADRYPEVARFKQDLKSMNPKHLGLVSDICELAERCNFPNRLDIKQVDPKKGKSLFAFLMEKLPKVSKENPEALNFTQEVINQTDSTTSRYFLASSTDLFDHPELAEHMSATKPLVKNIAEQTLDGSYDMDYLDKKSFMGFLRALINPNAKTEKISLVPKLVKAAEQSPGENALYLDSFVSSSAPVKQVEENLKVVPQVADMFAKEGKSLDFVDFVNNNVNLY